MASSAKTVAKAIELLRFVASSKARNLRLIDIAEMTALDKSTTHRLLQRLERERMLVRDPWQRGYRLGPLLYELGLAALPETNLRELSEPALRRLAETTGDMAFLIVRSGYETVCLNRIAGGFEIQTMTRTLGDRHPLGIGAGGLALLAAMADNEVRLALEAVAPQLPRYCLTESELRERIHAARETGYSLDQGASASGITAIGRAIRASTGNPFAATFVATISSRMEGARQTYIDRQLTACVKEIERGVGLRSQQAPGYGRSSMA